ncbi:MAG: RagB/SusD family nutrient uptake outer membrane protein, partial [Bacteroidia bacterium]
MKSLKITIAFILASALFIGCKDYLQDGSLAEGPITPEQNWSNDVYARGILNNAYFSVEDKYNLDGNGAMQASGTDEAVNSNLNSSINIFNNGTWGPVRTVNDSYNGLYEGLRVVNLFMANVQQSGIISQPSELATTPTAYEASLQGQIDRLKGQAFFLRAYFHFELLQRYGSLVLATRVFDRDENLNLPRNSFQECVDQIALDCDSAITRLPAWTQTWSTGQRGRATQTAAQALKSRLFL